MNGNPRFISRPKRYPNMDNGKYLTVRMSDEQYTLLQEYMEKSSLKQTTYFRKLIDGEAITANYHKYGIDPYTSVNMINSNIRQLARNPLALAANRESVKRLVFLEDKLRRIWHALLNFDAEEAATECRAKANGEST